MRRLPYLAYLLAIWVALWGEISLANVLSGLLVGGGLILLFPTAGPGPLGYLRPLRALKYAGYFLYKLCESTVIVAWEVLSPGSNINEGVVAVPITGASDAVVTLVANSISLTPGTLTIEVRREPATLYIHVLHLRSIEATRLEILELERLALEAFGRPEAIERAAQMRASQRPPAEELR
jgi:multicomponent Na+:H+ antiporter subunit E